MAAGLRSSSCLLLLVCLSMLPSGTNGAITTFCAATPAELINAGSDCCVSTRPYTCTSSPSGYSFTDTSGFATISSITWRMNFALECSTGTVPIVFNGNNVGSRVLAGSCACCAPPSTASAGTANPSLWNLGGVNTLTLATPYCTGFEAETTGCFVSVTVEGIFGTDECTNADPIPSAPCGGTFSGSTVGSTSDIIPSFCGTFLQTAGDIWYTMTPLAGSLVTAETTAASFDTKLAVVTDGCGTQTCVTGNDDGGSGTLSRVQWVADGSTYLIAVTGFGSSTGTFTLEVTTPRENDNLCGTPTAIGNPSGSIAGATSCATVDTPITSCGTGLGSSADVWYDYAASSTECRLVTFDTCTNSYDTKLAAFTGGCGTLGCITGNDDSCSTGSEVDVYTTPGEQYTVMVTGFSTNTGSFTLRWSSMPDSTAPTFSSCPASSSQNNDAGSCGADIAYTTPVATDDCLAPTVTRTSGPVAGTFVNLGPTTLTHEATDASGNTATCSFTVTVVDNEAPTLSPCPANIALNNDPGLCSAVTTYTAPVGADNCPGVTTTQTAGDPSGSAFAVGSAAQTFEATDSSGTATCTFIITVSDVEMPTASHAPPGIVTVPTYRPYGYTVTAGDNCGATATHVSGPMSTDSSATPVGPLDVVYQIEDAAGNSFVYTFQVQAVVALEGLSNPLYLYLPMVVRPNDALFPGTDVSARLEFRTGGGAAAYTSEMVAIASTMEFLGPSRVEPGDVEVWTVSMPSGQESLVDALQLCPSPYSCP